MVFSPSGFSEVVQSSLREQEVLRLGERIVLDSDNVQGFRDVLANENITLACRALILFLALVHESPLLVEALNGVESHCNVSDPLGAMALLEASMQAVSFRGETWVAEAVLDSPIGSLLSLAMSDPMLQPLALNTCARLASAAPGLAVERAGSWQFIERGLLGRPASVRSSITLFGAVYAAGLAPPKLIERVKNKVLRDTTYAPVLLRTIPGALAADQPSIIPLQTVFNWTTEGNVETNEAAWEVLRVASAKKPLARVFLKPMTVLRVVETGNFHPIPLIRTRLEIAANILASGSLSTEIALKLREFIEGGVVGACVPESAVMEEAA